MRAKAEAYCAGHITRDEYDFADMMQRSRLSNVSFYVQSCGEFVILAMIVGILFGVDVEASQANNTRGLSILIAFATGIWLLLAIPWFALEKRRPGQDVPPKMNMYDTPFLPRLWWLTCTPQRHGGSLAATSSYHRNMAPEAEFTLFSRYVHRPAPLQNAELR